MTSSGCRTARSGPSRRPETASTRSTAGSTPACEACSRSSDSEEGGRSHMPEWVRRHLDRWSDLSEQMPVDVLPASNGEFIPPPPTPQQRQVMALQDDAAEEVRHKLGMSRRTFVRSAS